MQENALYRFPHTGFPTGWFAVAGSHELAPGAVKPIHNFGTDLVLYRTEDGRAVVTDPFCPHLGAHLGYGGTVEGDAIRCPFHHFKFDPTGRCTHVPLAAAPARLRLRVWPTSEHNEMIFVWYDQAGRPPSWEMPDFEPTRDPELAGFCTYDNLKTYPQEVLENGADWLHFVTVHATRQLKGEVAAERKGDHNLLFRFWTRDHDTDPAMDHFRGCVDFYGPGYARNLSWGKPFPKMTVDHSVYVTPIDQGTLAIRSKHRIIPDEDCPMPPEALRQVFAGLGPEIRRQVEQDIVIWERKSYIDRPVLVGSDGPILKYREWFRQFYPEERAAAAE